MSWSVVAKKDFRDAVRSRLLIGLTVIFVLFAVGYTYLFGRFPQLFVGQGENVSTIALLSGMESSASLLVPLIALVVGYKAVVGERASGSLKLLLGLPHTRRDIVFGKLLGRTAVVTVSIIVGFVGAGIVALALYDSFAAVKFVVFTVLTVVFALVFVAIAVGFSAAMRSASRALYGAFGLFLLFQFVWGLIILVLRYAINGFSLPDLRQTPHWATFISSLNPQTAYSHAATALLPDLALGSTNSAPFYLQNWFGFVILSIWFIVPIGLGYLQFNGTDL